MNTLKRIGGISLIIIAIVSLLFSLVVLVGIWLVRQPITDAMTAGLGLASDTLQVTGQTLGVVDDGLATASELVVSAENTVDSLATTLDNTTPALQTVGDLVGTGVPAALNAANTTLRAAQRSAETVDGVLLVLSDLPLLNINYNPEVPLSQALRGISDSLEELPADLEQLGEQVTLSVETLPTLAGATRDLAGAMGGINQTLDDSRQAVQEYQQLMARYQGVVDFIQEITPLITVVIPLLVSMLVFWIMVVQVATARRGWEWVRQPAAPAMEQDWQTAGQPDATLLENVPMAALPEPAAQPPASQVVSPGNPHDSSAYQKPDGRV